METRDKVTYQIDAAGDEVPGPVMEFMIRKITEPQRQFRGNWTNTGPATYETVAQMNRDQLAALLADGVDWLRYIEGNDN